MKICEAFLVEYSRPLNALDKVSIAELAQFTVFDPSSSITKAAAAFDTLQGEWSWEYLQHDLEYLDFKGLRMFFKDGSSIKLKEQKR
jgi:hypothetical protein